VILAVGKAKKQPAALCLHKRLLAVENPKTWMLIASVMGASAGIYVTSMADPLNNYFIFMALFGVIGVGVANVVLLALYKIYEWLKQSCFTSEKTQSPQTT
jgi:multisubunit Na+/H+ antiporter MnhC subunit